jgi:hypothetical protein
MQSCKGSGSCSQTSFPKDISSIPKYSTCELCCQSENERGFSQSTSSFPRHYSPISIPYLYFFHIFWPHTLKIRGRDSSVGIATRYGLDGPGIESRWGQDFPHPSRPALGPTQPPTHWVESFPGVKRPGRGVDHPSHLAPRLKKE